MAGQQNNPPPYPDDNTPYIPIVQSGPTYPTVAGARGQEYSETSPAYPSSAADTYPPYVVGEAIPVKSQTMNHNQPVEAVPIQVQVHVQGPQAIAYGWNHESRFVQCPRCRAQVITQVTHDFGTAAWSFCIVGCICFGVCGLWPCCCLHMQDAHHQCPACQFHIAQVPGRIL